MRTAPGFAFVSSFLLTSLTLAAFGCSGDPLAGNAPDGGGGPPPGAQARLVPWQVETEGAPPLVMGIFDTQENVHCRFVPDEAGQLRCLPLGLADLQMTGMFADASCRQRIYQLQTGQLAEAEGRVVALPLPTAGCAAARYTVGRLAARAVGAARFAGTPCAAVESVSTPQDVWRDLAVVETVAPARFAPGAEVEGPRLAGRIRLRQIATGDGARFDAHFVDDHWGQPCTLETSRFGLTCWPPSAPDESMEHVDAQCRGLEVWTSGTCSRPAFIGANADTFYAVGPEWKGSVYRQGKGCSLVRDAAGSDPLIRYYERGAPLGADALATLQWMTSGTGRFRLRGLRGDGGAPVVVSDDVERSGNAARYEDTVTGQGCNPTWTPEGFVRCVPTSVDTEVVSLAMFADAACQTEAFYCNSPPCEGQPVIQTAVDVHGESRPATLRTRNAVSAVYFDAHDGRGCRPSDISLEPKYFFTLGETLSWDLFPRLDESHGRASGAP